MVRKKSGALEELKVQGRLYMDSILHINCIVYTPKVEDNSSKSALVSINWCGMGTF